MSPVSITPDQIPQLIAAHESSLAALNLVFNSNTQILTHLDSMESHIASGQLSSALALFVDIKRIEVNLQQGGLKEKLTQTEDILRQLRSPISMPHIRVPRQ